MLLLLFVNKVCGWGMEIKCDLKINRGAELEVDRKTFYVKFR